MGRAAVDGELGTGGVGGLESEEYCQAVVVTRPGDRNPLVAHFRESAKNRLARDTELVRS